MSESQPCAHGTRDGADLNATVQRLADRSVESGYTWWLQDGSTTAIVIAHPVDHPYSQRTLLVYGSGRSTTVFVAAPGERLRRITQHLAFSMLNNQTL